MDKQTTDAPQSFHVIAKPIGPICNLACKYCFYLEKDSLYSQKAGLSDWIMPDTVLEKYIRQHIESQWTPIINFVWQGGEPTLLGIDYFRKVVTLQQKYANGKRIENGLQTNGILLNDQWCEFLAKNHFLIGLSIDGPRQLNDEYRLDKKEAPTFEKVIKGVNYLKKHGVQFNTLTVVHRHNSCHPLDVYRFLKEVGSGFIQFIPIVERITKIPSPHGPMLVAPESSAPARVSDWSVEPLQYGKFLCKIFDYWVRNDVGSIFIQLFEVALAAWIGMDSSLCVFQPICGTAAVIEHNGDIYSCDHYVYPENKLGNIIELPLQSMMHSPQQISFGRNKLDRLPRYCLECKVRFICNGECPKHRFLRTPAGEEGLNYLCAGYKLFFSHIDPYMKFMATDLDEERSPSNVMTWIRKQKLYNADKQRLGRNDPCYCGSGKKFKRCCGQA